MPRREHTSEAMSSLAQIRVDAERLDELRRLCAAMASSELRAASVDVKPCALRYSMKAAVSELLTSVSGAGEGGAEDNEEATDEGGAGAGIGAVATVDRVVRRRLVGFAMSLELPQWNASTS